MLSDAICYEAKLRKFRNFPDRARRMVGVCRFGVLPEKEKREILFLLCGLGLMRVVTIQGMGAVGTA